jgi:hypothetical protein
MDSVYLVSGKCKELDRKVLWRLVEDDEAAARLRTGTHWNLIDFLLHGSYSERWGKSASHVIMPLGLTKDSMLNLAEMAEKKEEEERDAKD